MQRRGVLVLVLVLVAAAVGLALESCALELVWAPVHDAPNEFHFHAEPTPTPTPIGSDIGG